MVNKHPAARAALIGAASMIGLAAAQAQTTAPVGAPQAQPQQAQPGGAGATAQTTASGAGVEEIVVTAQRAAQSLQDVPIAVSAFSNEALERQQINNTSQLQLSLPNITFTKGNFTGANLTIRGIGSPAVATSGDAGVGIHYNDAPIQGPLIFESEYFDLERVEVLRGPQGTLFGRNATGGVLNFITAKAVTGELQARAEAEYGNYDSFRGFGMINVPLGDTLAVRVAGQYVKRDGYTTNIFPGNEGRFDGRDQWGARASIRWQPTDRTTVDLIGYWAEEDSNRMRIQKQVCNTDPTAILGCAPDVLGTGYVNANATLGNIVQSREFAGLLFAALAAPPPNGLGVNPSNFGNYTVYTPAILGQNPDDVRTVSTNFDPSYRTRERFGQLKLSHDFDTATFGLTASYQESRVSSRQDYNNVTGPAVAPNALLRAVLPQVAARLYQGNNLCISNASRRYSGIYGGDTLGCFPNPTQYDESNGESRTWSVEGLVSTSFDGPFNFRLGGIYIDVEAASDYFIVANGLDYASGLIGGLSSLAQGGGAFNAAPFFNSDTDQFRLRSYGLFGEAYWQMTDTLKLTLGLRYSNDKKRLRDRGTILLATGLLLPIGTADANPALTQRVDQDANIPGIQGFREARLDSDAFTGRAVIDWQPETSFSDDTLVYASYSRGYKPGGINPPFDASVFTAPTVFEPETINAFEIGTKNRFIGGVFQANLTAFYYDYKNLQISRIVNRTSFNDNTDAEVYGIEGEFIVAPTANWLFNLNASYLKTKVKDLSLVDVRDPSGGRADTVIIKDITNASNCVVTPATTLPAGAAAGFVNGFNAGLSSALGQPGLLRGVTPVPGTNAVGAFSVCAQLASTIASAPAPVAALFGLAPGSRLPFVLDPASRTPKLPEGNEVNLDGNELQNSPNWKVSAGAQYTADFGNDMSAVFRADLNFVGSQWGRNYNRPIDRIQPYETINLSVQLNGPEERWYLRGFVQNLSNNQGVTGLYVTDPSSGLFTNIFTLEPRRYGIVAGVRF